jgi:hypothetical protein
MNRKAIFNFCTTLIGICAAVLLLLEIALRIYNPIIQTVKGDKIVLRVNYDLITRNEYIRGVDHGVRKHVNSIGFRGEDPPADLSEKLSIITIGGSTTLSAFQSDDHTWTALAGAIRISYRGLDVVSNTASVENFTMLARTGH